MHKILDLVYEKCSYLFAEDLLEKAKINPDWRAAKISGKDHHSYLLESGFKGKIPSC